MKNKIYQGNSLRLLETFPNESIDCCVTSPPYYGLRDYGMDAQIGLEETPEKYIDNLVQVFSEVKRVLKDDGTLWIVIGDSFWGGKGKSGRGGGGAQQQRYDRKKTLTPAHCNIGKKGVVHPTDKKHECIKPKDLIGIPWMLAFALRADGWYLRQDIIWHKPNPMPESVKDRCTKSHEYIFLLSKSKRYYFDHEAIQEIATGYDGRKDTQMKGSNKYASAEIMPNGRIQTLATKKHERWRFKNLQDKGLQPNTIHEKRVSGAADELYPIRNKRDVWSISVKPYKGAHFAVFPEALIINCIKAGCPEGGIVLDPFMGSGTTGVVAKKLERNYVGCELNPKYIDIANDRIAK